MASPASSGPAGPHFEGQVGAFYLLAMLAGAEARGLPGCTIDKVRLQGAPEGHLLDDVIVHAHKPSGAAVTLEIQAKRHIDFTPSDKVFAAVMEQVSSTVKAPGFWQTEQQLAVATAHHSAQIDGPYQDVLTWARELGDASSFHRRLELPKVANESMRTFVSTFRDHLKVNGAPDGDQTVWALLRRFHILVFDFTARTSISEDLAKERAVRVLLPGQEHLAEGFWKLLVESSIKIASSGGERTRDQLIADFEGKFSFAILRRHHEALGRLEEFSRYALEDIATEISGVRLSRQKYVDQLRECLALGRYIEIRGDAGVGKSGILRHFAEQLASQGRVIVLSPNRTFLRGWSGMRESLDFNGTCRELLSEIAANGGGAIFVDNLDFFRLDERATVIDLLREAASVPGVIVVTTARRPADATDRGWLPANLLDRLVRTPVISVAEIDDVDRSELQRGAPQLVQLLSGNEQTNAVLGNLFRLSQLAERPGSEAIPRTETEMASVWWKTGGSHEQEGRRERTRLLKELAAHSLLADQSFDVSQWAAPPIDSLIKNETLLELKTDRIVFRHDVFREWAMACLLFDEPARVQELPLSKAAPPDLSRSIELMARMRIEGATDAANWLEVLNMVSGTDAHSSWRRAVLLALVRSEAGIEALRTAAAVLIHDKAALLCELIRLVLAIEVVPARDRFIAAGIDEKNVPASMMVPSGLSWVRLLAWIAYRVSTQLPPEAVPDVVKPYAGWCMSFTDGDPFSPKLVEQMYLWLREIEVAREPHPHWSNPGAFSGAIQGEQLSTLEDSLRFYFLAFARHVPHLAAEYLKTFQSRTYSDEIKLDILKFRGTLAMAAPAELADFTLATLIPDKSQGQGRRSALADGPFGYTDGKFLPCSPSQGPFFELLTHSPENGLRLIRSLVDYSVKFLSRGQYPGQDGITIQLPDGPRFFPWIHTYMWSREALGGPYLVTSGLMALEAWAHQRLDNEEPFDDVLQDVIGKPGAPVAYLLPVVDLILSHWDQAVAGAVPFVSSPELLSLDRPRVVRDNPPKLPKPAIVKELEQISKEPPGTVSVADLKKRNSRNWMLDRAVGNYAFLAERPELLEQVRSLLKDAAARLGPPDKSHSLYNPEFMVVHALNTLNPANYTKTNLPLKGGGSIDVPVYNPPVDESAHLAGLDEVDGSHDDSAQRIRSQIKAAISDDKLFTEQFFETALAFVQNDSNYLSPEEEPWPGSVPPQMEDSISLAFLVVRDGISELRKKQDAWVKQAFAQSFTESEKEAHRHRSENQFNPQAFSFAGYVWLLKHDKSPENIRLVLHAASFNNPATAFGLKATAQYLAHEDIRLIRAVLRCAFTAQIGPGRDWKVRKPEREQQALLCEQDIAARVEAEATWLLQNNDEPAWPAFPQEWPTLRNTFHHRAADKGDEVKEEQPLDRFNFSYHGAAEWLKAVDGLADTFTRTWFRQMLEFYRVWTVTANGAGVDKDEQIDGFPTAWNEIYFELLAGSLPGLSVDQVETLITRYFAELPDDSLFETFRIFLKAVDVSFFNRHALSDEVAVLVRTRIGKLLQASHGWKWLQDDRTDSVESHIADVVTTYFFNDSGGFFLPSKPYLSPAGISRITPFLKPLLTLALDCLSPRVGAVALNLFEVAPNSAHLSFLIAVGAAWGATYQDSVQFWIDFRFGKRISTLFETILVDGVTSLEQVEIQALDQILGHLVRLGIPEALRAETLLRSIEEGGK